MINHPAKDINISNMGKQRKNPPCPVFENIRCKYSVQGQKCRIDGCYDPAEINRNSNIHSKI